MTVVSYFYDTEGTLYRAAAMRLQEDCARLGLKIHIQERLDFGKTWIELCRAKPVFILEMCRRFRGPILFVDADCRLKSIPDIDSKKTWGFLPNAEDESLKVYDHAHYCDGSEEAMAFCRKWQTAINILGGGSHSALKHVITEVDYFLLSNNDFEIGITDTKSKQEYFRS